MDSTTLSTDAADDPSLAPDEIDGLAARSLIFRAGGRVYCCDVSAVREVVPLRVITRIPGAAEYVLGIINVRGTIVTVLDAGLYLHGHSSDRRGSVMLVEVGARSVGLLVDAVADVRPVRPSEGYQTLDVRATVARVIAIREDE